MAESANPVILEAVAASMADDRLLRFCFSFTSFFFVLSFFKKKRYFYET
jgi:hypothetical protein